QRAASATHWRLPRHGPRSADDVRQPDAPPRALRGGDHVRAGGAPMTLAAWSIRRLDVVGDAEIAALADLLIDCVEGGASVSFMAPLGRERAAAFWRRVGAGVGAGERALLVAKDAEGICGTVQLVLDLPENQPHRADVTKMLVHRRARRRGLGAALM